MPEFNLTIKREGETDLETRIALQNNGTFSGKVDDILIKGHMYFVNTQTKIACGVYQQEKPIEEILLAEKKTNTPFGYRGFCYKLTQAVDNSVNVGTAYIQEKTTIRKKLYAVELHISQKQPPRQ